MVIKKKEDAVFERALSLGAGDRPQDLTQLAKTLGPLSLDREVRFTKQKSQPGLFFPKVLASLG